ncbi:MAG: hypothetical protein HDQ98_05810 [Lachnospiraceae bacterium]|nr:hypothetical protein [Lachnospiraceae bacterium]
MGLATLAAGEAATTVAEQANSAVTAALTSTASQMGSMVVTVVPIALGVVAGIMVVNFGVKLFKRLTNKG